MSDYFSQLARHSGLGAPSGPRTERSASPALPMTEISETAAAAPLAKFADKAAPQTTANISETDAPPAQARAQTPPANPPTPAPEPLKQIFPATASLVETTIPSAAPETDAPFETASIKVTEQPRPVAPESLAAQETMPSPKVSRPAPLAEEKREIVAKTIAAPVAVDAPKPLGEENYFGKTSGMLARPAADQAEIQRVFLQEVRAWVAAPPELVTAEQTSEAAPQSAPAPLPTILKPREEAAAEPFRKVSVPTPTLAEQEFSVTIGNISVVVEQPPPAPTAPPARPAPAPERGPARLSRYYL